MKPVPDFAIYLSGLVSTVFFVICGIYFASNRTLGIWTLFGGIVFGLLTGFLYWQNDISKTQASKAFNREAQKQASNELRPWISILGIHTNFQPDFMQIQVLITNYGELPAYVLTEANGHKDGKLLKNTTVFHEPALLMPNQSGKNDIMTIKGDSYKAILEGTIEPEVTISIRINYGLSREEIGTFFVYRKVKLDYGRLRLFLKDPKQPAEFWLHEESGFK